MDPINYETTPRATKPRNKKKMFGFTSIIVDEYNVNISTPEKTIVDCLDHPEHCGGIEEVAKAIYFEHDERARLTQQWTNS